MRCVFTAAVLAAAGCTLPLAVFSSVAQLVRCPTSYSDERYEHNRLTHYTVPDLRRSPDGVPIGPGVDGVAVDAVFNAVAGCLGRKFYPCGVHAIMIAPDWRIMPDSGGRQAFPCDHPNPSVHFCTGAVQWPATVVITPDHRALAWEAERLILRDDPTADRGRGCWEKAVLPPLNPG